MSEYYPNNAPNDYTQPGTTPIYTPPDAYTTADVAPPPPYVPDAAPAPAPRGRNRLPLFIGVLLALAAIAAGVFYVLTQTKAPQQAGALLAARNFCAAEQKPDYPNAYTYFSPNLQLLVPQDAFTTISEGADTTNGKITNCSANGVDVSKDGKSATVHGAITRNKTGKQNADLAFVYINGNWKIDKSPDPALLPLTTAYSFCKDIKLNQFDAAYALMSTNLQSAFGSSQGLQQDLAQAAQLTGALNNCAGQGFTLDASKESGIVQAALDFANFPGTPTKLYEILDSSGAWKLDKLEFLILGTPTAFPIGS